MIPRSMVYGVIDLERDYQVKRWQYLSSKSGLQYRPDNTKTTEEWLIYILGYYRDAVQEASHQPGGGNDLHVVRKLAALCVACMEANGVVSRVPVVPPFELGKTKREDVYKAIDLERDYQDKLGSDRTDRRQHSVCGYLCMFDTYLRRAIDAWTDNAGDVKALDNIRKLAAICVNCMEHHGAPKRGDSK